jgi:two-component system response regulator YesN
MPGQKQLLSVNHWRNEDTAIKLLIVDDENLTRTGLMSSIEHLSLDGIDEIFTAEDGMDGLRKARSHRPEIILSDVRMPHLNGIDMLNRIRETLPDTVFIFMSGYSDKEYLKAAIRLHAVNYIEKPLDMEEMKKTLQEAIRQAEQIIRNRYAETVQEDLSASRLALCLTLPTHASGRAVDDLSEKYCSRYGSVNLFRSAATVLLHTDEREELHPDFLDSLKAGFYPVMRQMRMHTIAAEKRTGLFVFHFFRKAEFTESTIKLLMESMIPFLQPVRSWYLCCGDIVSGIKNLYDSYSSAVILLQHSFFYTPCSILVSPDVKGKRNNISPSDFSLQIQDAVRNADEASLAKLSASLKELCAENGELLPRAIQSLYFQLITFILDESRRRQLQGSEQNRAAEEVYEEISSCFSYQELHECLNRYIRQFLEEVNSHVPENSSVFLIKSYIRQHYADPMLSTKEISEYASLSASYACTVFKNETGQTLNQYLTEFRMEKAKALLDDPRNSISEISSRVGYNDSNYFGKAFRKFTGKSPSEYREDLLK